MSRDESRVARGGVFRPDTARSGSRNRTSPPRSRAIGVEVDGGAGSRGASAMRASCTPCPRSPQPPPGPRRQPPRSNTWSQSSLPARRPNTRFNRAHCGRREHHGGDLVDVVVAGETRAAGLGKSEPAVAASPAGGCARAANRANLSSAARRDAQAHGERTRGCLRHRVQRVEGGRARGTMRGPLFGRCAFSGREEKSRELAGKNLSGDSQISRSVIQRKSSVGEKSSPWRVRSRGVTRLSHPSVDLEGTFFASTGAPRSKDLLA